MVKALSSSRASAGYVKSKMTDTKYMDMIADGVDSLIKQSMESVKELPDYLEVKRKACISAVDMYLQARTKQKERNATDQVVLAIMSSLIVENYYLKQVVALHADQTNS